MVKIKVQQYNILSDDDSITTRYDLGVYHSGSRFPRYTRTLYKDYKVEALIEWLKGFYDALGVKYEVSY